MQTSETASAIHPDLVVSDLGPLAWVLDELRKSLDTANKSLKRFVRDAEAARGTDLASVDASQLRMARQQMHQAVGALEMVDLVAPAQMLRGMEAAVQQFVQHPERCNEGSAAVLERASFALIEYLNLILGGGSQSAVGLFPQYRDAQLLAGAERIHPADLWAFSWRWNRLVMPDSVTAGIDNSAVERSLVDQLVLKIMQKGDSTAADELRGACLALAVQAGTTGQGRSAVFWNVAAAMFEAVAQGLLSVDLYVKRAASQVLLQYAMRSQVDKTPPERLAKDLLFFCAQALPRPDCPTPCLVAVRSAFGLEGYEPVSYETRRYGKFDPSVLLQARKRIDGVKDAWTALCGGDVARLKNVGDQFGLVAESILKLHPQADRLAQGLKLAADQTARSGKPPGAEIALEVATSVLYLEAALEEAKPDDEQVSERMSRLAERLELVCAGGQAEPLESWMEELYRRVSDRQTMGTVVSELRVTLSEAEKSLDEFFRDPLEKTVLHNVPGLLAQMRGVLSVLGLDQAAQAVIRMREVVERILDTEVDMDLARTAGTFDTLGNNFGALGFLIDMLNYQPALAKRLFVFDTEQGELRPVMGRTVVPEVPDEVDQQPTVDSLSGTAMPPQDSSLPDVLSPGATMPMHAPSAQEVPDAVRALAQDPAGVVESTRVEEPAQSAAAPAVPSIAGELVGVAEFDEDDLQGIFLEEADEVIRNGLEALRVLGETPEDLTQQTTLRRAFHTLKGSSRMVGLNTFGEAAWSMEQVLNAWLAEQKPVTNDLCALCAESLHAFAQWAQDIAAGQADLWQSAPFSQAADAMRTQGVFRSLVLPTATPEVELPVESDELPSVEHGPGELVEPPTPESQATGIDLALDAVDADTAEISQSGAEPAPVAETDADLPAEAGLADSTPAEEEPSPAVTPEPVLSDAEALALFDDIEAASTEVIALDLDAPVADVLTLHHDADDALDVLATAEGADELARVRLDASDAPEIADIDMDALSALTLALQEPVDAPDQQVPPEADAASEGFDDEQVKVIGSLRIGIPLYNVYLNEADEWSRRLESQLNEWEFELDQPVPAGAEALAHSLAGSSATVGFLSLSETARALEHALQRMRGQPRGTSEQGRAFSAAAQEIRRLLHQFAAGFLKDADPHVLAGIKSLTFAQDLPSAQSAAEGTLADTWLEPAAFEPPARAETGDMSPDAAEVVSDDDQTGEPLVSIELTGDDQTAAPLLDTNAAIAGPEGVAQPPVGELAPSEPEPSLPPVSAPAQVAAPSQVVPVTRSFTGGDIGSDDIDLVDVLDPDLFPIFEEEAAELLPQLGGALRQWVARPENLSARGEVLRALHTLKGSSRLAGALRLGEMSHRMESEIESIGTESIQDGDVAPLLASLDAMEARFEALRRISAQGFEAEAVPPRVEEQPQPAPAVAAVEFGDVSSAARGPVALPTPMLAAPVRAAANQAVRVRSQLLDRLVNQAGEVMITRSRLEAEMGQLRGSLQDLTVNLDRLRSQLRDIELQAESQMQSRMAQAKDSQQNFDPLEFDRFTRVQELTRMMAESVNDVATVQRSLQRTVEATEDDLVAQARQTRALQQDLLRTRMMEFEGISERLYRVVRQASKDTAKQVKLDITGGNIEMDRGVLDRMTAAFEHLLRNCVVHGIEDPQTREAAGKDPVGTIAIDLAQAGNDVSVVFRDDGAGLNLPRILQKGREAGLIEQGQELSDAEASNLIFMPGISTASEVTDLAGRGIGMDVVRSEIQALGGRIETETRAGRGTSFKLVLPLTTAVTQVVLMRSGNLTVGIPANLVELVRRVSADELKQAYALGSLQFGGETIPFYWSGALLQSSSHTTETAGRTTPVVIFRSAAQRVALHLDEILGNQEAVVKNLGPQLSRLPGLAGMTVLASGAVVLIYNPVALSAIYGEQARRISQVHQQALDEPATTPDESGSAAQAMVQPAVAQVPLVLVVDDSITVRRVTQRLLQREGYRVALAIDGLQALERLQEERPVVVLSDIEMPRMDGFDLARNIRGDARLGDLPIVMITSRIAEKHREHAQALGVNHYLGKPYSEEELLSLVRRYAEAPVTA